MDEVAGKRTSSHKIAETLNAYLAKQRETDGDATTKKVSPTTANRWRQSDEQRPDADKVVIFCRAYGENPIVGLIKAGYLTEDEARAAALALMSLDELLAEVKAEGEREAKGISTPYSRRFAEDLAAEIERRTQRRQ